ncbi:unnamed protein product [Psylliodes chrysocephalus]|uniref:Lipase domain-containing protein n=1 Tax=Psylliodes chrysocephalus TaxID=3402493 RepID=A0A9P0CBY8_9CUCU|nr:unnamed protein product [Psylliodes chrysocephala]
MKDNNVHKLFKFILDCTKTCGINAKCDIVNNVQTCVCILSIMEGDPNVECINPELTPVDFSLATATRNDVTYEFYTASSGKCDISKLNKHHRTIIITHGYRGTITENWIQEAKEAFLKLNIYNIILVNWTPAAGPLLSAAGNNVKRVGKYLAQTILGAKLRPELIQIVGFALGSHVAGHAGKYITAKTFRTLGRITALESSGKMEVAGTFPESRLNQTDALFVDVVHTNTRRIGYKKTIGHCDWYVNFGSVQPGCEVDPTQNDFCSHKRSQVLYVESITKKVMSEEILVSFDEDDNATFTPLPRPKKIVFGQWVNLNARGVYLLKTRSTEPLLI